MIVTETSACSGVTFARVVVTVIGAVVGRAPGMAIGTMIDAVPAGALPGLPYFHASCATRKVCSASEFAAVRIGPPWFVEKRPNALAAYSAPSAATATSAAVTAASTRAKPRSPS